MNIVSGEKLQNLCEYYLGTQEQFNYNPIYNSYLEPVNHNYPEDEKSVNNRVKKFITKLINETVDSKHNVLIVSHQIVCNCLLKISTKKIKGINIEYTYNYPKGGLTKIFDTNEWYFEPINWKFIL